MILSRLRDSQSLKVAQFGSHFKKLRAIIKVTHYKQ